MAYRTDVRIPVFASARAGVSRTAWPTGPFAARWSARALLLAAALAAGCASRPTPPMPIEPLEEVGRKIAERPCENPDRINTRPQPNLHDPKVTDEVIETYCPGWVVTVYVANGTQPPKLLPASVQLTVKHPRLPQDLQVGSSAAQVTARLGPPTVRDPAALAYRLGWDRPDGDTLRFILRQGQVAAIEWTWYVD